MSIELSPDIIKSISLYPDVEDNQFNLKITNKKEFNKTKSDVVEFTNIEDYANDIPCEFTELLPHQIFVKNFLSFLTPYNSLLLFHGLGSGKTCSAIGIAETMRIYLKNMGIKKKILIVATPNIQDNFKKQLFDENKLKEIKGQYTLKSCVGNNLLNEIRTNKYSSKKTIVSQINKIIDDGYEFMGYTKLSHLIEQKKTEKKINSFFEDRLIIIDEVHNIRVNDDAENKKIATNLFELVKKVKNIKLLLLSATPMFNSYKEIIWIMNLMNYNDNRPKVEEKEIFDKNGDFLIDNDSGEEIGKKKFVEKITGYVSFVKGENPFTFPYRIFPLQFDKKNSFLDENNTYPRIQFNGQQIIQPLEHVDVFKIGIGEYQKNIYLKIINNLLSSSKKNELGEITEKFGYNKMQVPLESLNITYPIQNFEEELNEENINEFVGKEGLSKIVKNTDKLPYIFYSEYLEKSNNKSIFAYENIKKYSYKIHSIIDSILNNEGITIVYSQYLYGGLIPLAIALEEIGFTRFTKKHNLLDDDYKSTHRIKNKKTLSGKNLQYAMITGSTALFSSQNANEIKNSVNEDNINGDIIKVILISRAGSEGIDLKNIRSIHIMEPWYNMNRIEQIIGRGVRNCSHRLLPYKNRNVQIYLYGTILENEENNIEGIDLYLYRISELKALKVGAVTRLLKETSIDCLLSFEYNNLLTSKLNKKTKQELANQQNIEIDIGDKPYSAICDYMESCSYKCNMINNNNLVEIDDNNELLQESNINNDTMDDYYVKNNVYHLIYNIKLLFKEKHFYYYDDIINRLTHFNKYTEEEINNALNILIMDNNEEIVDIYGRVGKIIKHGNIYFFQPYEITSNNISLNERITTIDYKPDKLELINDEKLSENNNNSSNLNNLFDFNEYLKLVDIYVKSREFVIINEIIMKSNFQKKK